MSSPGTGRGAPRPSRQLYGKAENSDSLNCTATVTQNSPAGSTTRRPAIYSYTFMNCYDSICPHQAYRRYIKKNIPVPRTAAIEWGNRVHFAMELRISQNVPLPADMRQWDLFADVFHRRNALVEEKLGINDLGEGEDFWGTPLIRGKVDAVVMNGNRAYINDWKTGKRREDPFELEVGALLLQANYPHIEIIKGTYTWLAEGAVGNTHDLSDTDATWGRCLNIIERIESDQVFEKRAGPLCKWCDVLDCENNRKPK